MSTSSFSKPVFISGTLLIVNKYQQINKIMKLKVQIDKASEAEFVMIQECPACQGHVSIRKEKA
jgi:hypothetical protein